MKKKLIAAFLGLLLLTAAGCAGAPERSAAPLETTAAQVLSFQPEETTVHLFAMDTYLDLTAYGPEAKDALAAAEARITELESLWSVTDAGSEIYAVNHSGGEPVTVSEDTANLLNFALKMAERTGGSLDPTLYPVLTAWGFTTGQYQIPTQEEIQTLLASTGYGQVGLDGSAVTLPAGMELDLGAVGKGYAADETAKVLREYGIESALLNFGGNVLAIGNKPDGSPWRIGIRDPFTEGNTLGIIELAGQSIVVSGGYERYFTGEDGTQYWHILDPDTGAPARSGLAQAAIISSDSKVCDALSTAVYVMGLEDAIEFWRTQQDFQMILVTDSQEIYATEGVANQLRLRGEWENQEVHMIGEKS